MEYVGDSRTGLVRSINQDSILLLSNEHGALYVVADGMGGHLDGEKASKAITKALEDWWNYIVESPIEREFLQLVSSVRNCVEQVNSWLFNTYHKEAICGSTVSILLIYHQQYAIFHVGDSRIYSLKKGKLVQMTIDEVWENDIRTKKKFSIKEILNSSKRGKLVNAIGTEPALMMNIKTDYLSENTVFLLCSDGLYKMVPKRYITKMMRKIEKGSELTWVLNEMMKRVYLSGAKDNVSILLIRAKSIS